MRAAGVRQGGQPKAQRTPREQGERFDGINTMVRMGRGEEGGRIDLARARQDAGGRVRLVSVRLGAAQTGLENGWYLTVVFGWFMNENGLKRGVRARCGRILARRAKWRIFDSQKGAGFGSF